MVMAPCILWPPRNLLEPILVANFGSPSWESQTLLLGLFGHLSDHASVYRLNRNRSGIKINRSGLRLNFDENRDFPVSFPP